MRGTVSTDQRVYHYESPFLKQGEHGLTLSQLRAQFIKELLNNPRAKYVTENYTLEKGAASNQCLEKRWKDAF